jgi:hypothetical protein
VIFKSNLFGNTLWLRNLSHGPESRRHHIKTSSSMHSSCCGWQCSCQAGSFWLHLIFHGGSAIFSRPQSAHLEESVFVYNFGVWSRDSMMMANTLLAQRLGCSFLDLPHAALVYLLLGIKGWLIAASDSLYKKCISLREKAPKKLALSALSRTHTHTGTARQTKNTFLPVLISVSLSESLALFPSRLSPTTTTVINAEENTLVDGADNIGVTGGPWFISKVQPWLTLLLNANASHTDREINARRDYQNL